MIAAFSTVVIIALILFLLISINYTRATVLEDAKVYSEKMIGLVSNDIDSYIDYMENISTMIAESADVQQYLFSNITLDKQSDIRKRIVSQIMTVKSSRKDIANIAALTDNGRSFINAGTEKPNSFIDYKNADWYQKTMSVTGKESIITSHVQNLIRSSYEWVITLSRQLKNERSHKTEGIFIVDLNYSAISSLCEQSGLGQSGYVFIIDEEGNLIYHPRQLLIYGGLLSEYITECLTTKKTCFLKENGASQRLYTVTKSAKTGWTIVSAAYVSELLKKESETKLLYMIVAFLLIAIVVVVTNVIAGQIVKPIIKMKKAIKLVEKGHFAGARIEVTEENEFGELGNSFNKMAGKIEDLIQLNTEEQKQKRAYELKALQAQINPHFLYNTLDSIIWMSASNKNEQVVLMTSALAKFFRLSISNPKEEVTIAEEIDYVRNYLIIQKMRYVDKMNYDITVEEGIEKVSIIRFVLQPLVENAIYHGLKYKKGRGSLSVKGFRVDDTVVLQVIDNGNGMSEEKLASVQKEGQEKGVGIKNVMQRLKLYYGENYGLTIESIESIGTIASVTIPFREVL